MSEQKSEQKVDEKLLEILVCPVDKASVRLEGDFLICSECKRKYPIREGIPVMLVEEAIIEET